MKQLIFTSIVFCVSPRAGLSQYPGEISGEYVHSFGKNYTASSIGTRFELYDNNNSRNNNNSSKGSWSLGINYSFSSSHALNKTSKSRRLGLFAGYRYGLKYGISGNLYGGVRSLFEFSKDDLGNKYSLFTPLLELGYHYTSQDFGKGGAFASFISLGYDIKMTANRKTNDIHEGALFSPGISVGYRF